MALTVFLFKICNLESAKPKSDIFTEIQDQATETINEEDTYLFCAKVTFRGIYINQCIFFEKKIFFFFFRY